MSTIAVEIIRPREELGDRRWQDPDQLICPVCVEPVRPEPPAYWVAADGLPVPQFSHEDASPLCKTTGDDGEAHAEPIPAKW